MRVRKRVVAVLAAAVALTLTLSACQVKAGQAAFVEQDSITETEVASYVTVDAPAPAAGKVGAKTFVVQELVKRDVLDDLAKTLGDVPTDEQLAELHDEALSSTFQISIAGADADKQLRDALAQLGVKATFDPIYIRNVELSTAIASYLQNASSTEQNKVQSDIDNIDVRINPRYGTWDPTNLAVSVTSSPSWLKSA